jgi:small-conductance mechanosensitive channel
MFAFMSPLILAAEADQHIPSDDVAAQTIDAVWTMQDAVVGTLKEVYQQLVRITPNALAAVLILVAGYVLARLMARVAVAVATSIGLEAAAQRSGLTASMRDVGIERSVPSIVGLIVFWLLMCVAFMAGFRVLELQVLSESMQQLVNYIPKILVATVLVVIGLLVATFLRGIVATSADRVGISYAEHLANASYYALAAITFLAAAGHLGLQLELLEKLILIGFSALAVGFGLALGLGGRDVVGGILAGYYIRQRFAAGDRVRVAGMEGTVRDVGPVATVIETDEGGLVHRHSIPNAVLLREGIR